MFMLDIPLFQLVTFHTVAGVRVQGESVSPLAFKAMPPAYMSNLDCLLGQACLLQSLFCVFVAILIAR